MKITTKHKSSDLGEGRQDRLSTRVRTYTIRTDNNSCAMFQLGFKMHQSTESARLKVTSDSLLTLISGSCTVLLLLDLSAVFHKGDHGVLLKQLECEVGIQDLVLKWVKSRAGTSPLDAIGKI